MFMPEYNYYKLYIIFIYITVICVELLKIKCMWVIIMR